MLRFADLRACSSFTAALCLFLEASKSGVMPFLSGVSGLTSSRSSRSFTTAS